MGKLCTDVFFSADCCNAANFATRASFVSEMVCKCESLTEGLRDSEARRMAIEVAEIHEMDPNKQPRSYYGSKN